MEISELLGIIRQGEDSRHQFKSNIKNEISLGQELVAFSNSGGGSLLIGVNDDGSFSGLQTEDIGRLNQLISNAASQQVRPAINPITENLETPSGLVIHIEVANGVNKPYMDKNGVVWVKSGADKRKATAREEIQRMYQSAGLLHGDEIPVSGTTVADLDQAYFATYFEKAFGESIEDQGVSLADLLRNMNLLVDGSLNISCALLFAKKPHFKLPAFIVKAIAFYGNEIHDTHFLDSRDIHGKIAEVFQQSKSFCIWNIHHIQGDRGINEVGEPEVPSIVFDELIANALIHRDYLVSAPIRILIFRERIEIISPGHLPNHLTVENIKRGNSNIRNPILASFATRVLPYRGLGSGIIRALKAYPKITFEDDRDGNFFKATIWREPSPKA